MKIIQRYCSGCKKHFVQRYEENTPPEALERMYKEINWLCPPYASLTGWVWCVHKQREQKYKELENRYK